MSGGAAAALAAWPPCVPDGPGPSVGAGRPPQPCGYQPFLVMFHAVCGAPGGRVVLGGPFVEGEARSGHGAFAGCL
eukprot:7493684-Lingulodinium_polyedra.AAC.1